MQSINTLTQQPINQLMWNQTTNPPKGVINNDGTLFGYLFPWSEIAGGCSNQYTYPWNGAVKWDSIGKPLLDLYRAINKYSKSSFSSTKLQYSLFLSDSKHSNLIIIIWKFCTILTQNSKSCTKLKYYFTFIFNGKHLFAWQRQNRRVKLTNHKPGYKT